MPRRLAACALVATPVGAVCADRRLACTALVLAGARYTCSHLQMRYQTGTGGEM